MIGKSDLVILAISGTLLAIGIYRWQSSLQPVERPSVAVRAPAPQPAPGNVPLTSNTAQGNGSQSAVSPTADVVQGVASTAADAGGVNDSASETASDSSSQATTPETGTGGIAGETTADAQDTGLYGTYIVEPGDNLTYIAGILDTSVETLRSLNDIEGSLIYVDQRLRYPLPAN